MEHDVGGDPVEMRLARIEAMLAIQQLACRYAMAVDQRDLETLGMLFVDDVDLKRHGRGREALRAWFDPFLRTFYRSMHQICGHVIDIDDDGHARGKVYCRAEHESYGRWMVVIICYSDVYERRNGSWYFGYRKEEHWYSNDVLQRPGEPDFDQWPDEVALPGPSLPRVAGPWSEFWAKSPPADIARLTRFPLPIEP